MREKTIELLSDAPFGVNKQTLKSYLIPEAMADVADHLIANGITFATDNNVGDKMTPTDKDTNVLTNADRIRAMSDEELATLLSELCWNGEHCYSCPFYGKSCGGINGLSGWLDWAKQPAEVEHE